MQNFIQKTFSLVSILFLAFGSISAFTISAQAATSIDPNIGWINDVDYTTFADRTRVVSNLLFNETLIVSETPCGQTSATISNGMLGRIVDFTPKVPEECFSGSWPWILVKFDNGVRGYVIQKKLSTNPFAQNRVKITADGSVVARHNVCGKGDLQNNSTFTVPDGLMGKVMSAPGEGKICVGSIDTYIKVKFDNGYIGWVPGANLNKIDINTPLQTFNMPAGTKINPNIGWVNDVAYKTFANNTRIMANIAENETLQVSPSPCVASDQFVTNGQMGRIADITPITPADCYTNQPWISVRFDNGVIGYVVQKKLATNTFSTNRVKVTASRLVEVKKYVCTQGDTSDETAFYVGDNQLGKVITTINEGRVCAGNRDTFFEVKFDNGKQGWIRGSFLNKVNTNIPVPATPSDGGGSPIGSPVGTLGGVTTLANYGGYYLPFPGGASVVVSQSCIDETEPGCTHSGNTQTYNKYSVDFGCSLGQSIVASKGGKVVISQSDGQAPSYGNVVKIQHPDGKYTLYAHMNDRSVSVGDTVGQGAKVGSCGSTGVITNQVHLHFETRATSSFPVVKSYFEECMNNTNCTDGQVRYNKTYISKNTGTLPPVVHKFANGDRVIDAYSGGLVSVRNPACSNETQPLKVSYGTRGTVINGTPYTGNCNLTTKPWWHISWDNGVTGWVAEADSYGNILLEKASNSAPIVSITSPTPNQIFNPGTPVNIVANASDPDGTVAKVEFFDGVTKIGEDLDGSNGWSYNWLNPAAGIRSLTAKATDNVGASTTSVVVSIEVKTEIKFKLGDVVESTSINRLRFYNQPCAEQSYISLSLGDTATINSADPVIVSNCIFDSTFTTWWKVSLPDGTIGWLPEKHLIKNTPFPLDPGPVTKEYEFTNPDDSTVTVNFKYYAQSGVLAYSGTKTLYSSCSLSVQADYLEKTNTDVVLNLVYPKPAPLLPPPYTQMCFMSISTQNIQGYKFMTLTQDQIDNFSNTIKYRSTNI